MKLIVIVQKYNNTEVMFSKKKVLVQLLELVVELEVEDLAGSDAVFFIPPRVASTVLTPPR